MISVERNYIDPRHGALILGLQFLLLAFRLGDVSLLGPDEPRYARVAVEMARGNEFVTPTLAGEPWMEKPPLYYWLAGFGFRLFGETEFAARLPAVIAALLMTGMTGVVGARLFGESCGRLAMIVAATSPLTFIYGKAATMDLLVAAFVTLATSFFLLRMTNTAGPSATHAAWLSMGFAVLAKGPIGVLIPIGIVIAACLLGRSPDAKRLISPLSFGLFLLVGAPWFVAIYADQGFRFIEVFILNHNLQRFTSTIHNHPGPVYYYLPVLAAGLFPWSILAFPAASSLRSLDSPAKTMLASWFLVPALLFSAAGSKLPGYILPCVPPLAIALALSTRTLSLREFRVSPRVAGLVGLAIAALLAALAWRSLRLGQPWGRAAMAPALWLLATMFITSRMLQRAPVPSTRVLTTGAAGLLLLLNLVAPPVVEALESGRRLFAPAQGREVLAVGAWRTAWMAGYFYNDGRVREIGVEDGISRASRGPALFLLGPAELRRFETRPGLEVFRLAVGPRENTLALAGPRRTP